MPRSIHTLGDLRDSGYALIACCRDPACRRQQLLDLDMLITMLGRLQPLLPSRGAAHFADKLRCRRCNQLGAILWVEIPYDPKPLLDGMAYKINNWDQADGLISTVAYARHEGVANFAFDGAVSSYPGRRITLQQGMRVIRDSRFRVVSGGRV